MSIGELMLGRYQLRINYSRYTRFEKAFTYLIIAIELYNIVLKHSILAEIIGYLCSRFCKDKIQVKVAVRTTAIFLFIVCKYI